jgi:uncharacterized membrane-anchored protein
MTTTAASRTTVPTARQMLNKVPEVTVYFWLVMVLCTTVGETFADNLTDSFGMPLVIGTALLSVALAAVFAGWWASERTLSIHSITSVRRDARYWLAILFTFALGTAAGDLIAEKLNVGYGKSGLLFAAAIALTTGVHYLLKARLRASQTRHTSNAVLAYWLAYLLTRPLGASGDHLSHPIRAGGLGLGTVVTSVLFLGAILGLVVFLPVTRIDRIIDDEAVSGGAEWEPAHRRMV